MLSCDVAQRSLSALADGEPPDAPASDVEAHLDGCADCRSFDLRLREVHNLLRLEPVGEVPDIARAVLARLPERRPNRWRAPAAAALVGALAGATFVGVGGTPATVAAADLPERVVEVQPAVTTLAADVAVVARGQRWTGTLRYEAPESLAVALHDDDGALLATVADDGSWWEAGPVGCVPPTLARCAPDRLEAVERRAPFADDTAVPLELVAPVDSLARSAAPPSIGERDGAIGVRVTAGQVDGLLRGIDPTGALPPVHATDPVDLWLDAEHLVPLEVVVRAADTPERARWSASRGLADRAGDEILAVRLADVEIDEPLPADAFPDPPAGADVRDGGFDDGRDPLVVPVPASLPDGLTAGRAGTVGDVGVRTWSDGRAWLAVRATSTWHRETLFGDLGDFVVPVDLGTAGVGYASADGTRLALRTDDLDLVVLGSVGPDALRAVAASLGVVGQPVNKGWTALTGGPSDLLVASDLDGFEGPAVRIHERDVTLRYTGPGTRTFLVVRSDDARLAPPRDPDLVAVEVRGSAGRWSPSTGDLEWVEDGHARALRSSTLSLDELLAIAETLRRR